MDCKCEEAALLETSVRIVFETFTRMLCISTQRLSTSANFQNILSFLLV